MLQSCGAWLTHSSEEVAVLGEGHERLGQFSKPLLKDASDGMDGEVLQPHSCGICRTGRTVQCEPGAEERGMT